jgi:Fic family protein
MDGGRIGLVHQGAPSKERSVPIEANQLPSAMRLGEAFAHADAQDDLAQAAMLHAASEALHPFLDGDGRPGRMLIRCSWGTLGSLVETCST